MVKEKINFAAKSCVMNLYVARAVSMRLELGSGSWKEDIISLKFDSNRLCCTYKTALQSHIGISSVSVTDCSIPIPHYGSIGGVDREKVLLYSE